MNHWLNLFTGKTWKEFQAAGGRVSGFRESTWNRVKNIRPGDRFICYLIGVKRWVGLLEIQSERFKDESPVYEDEVFPIRFRVKPIVTLTPEHGVPMENFAGQLTFYPEGATAREWSGYVRGSPTRYKPEDGAIIEAAILGAQSHPVFRPVDAKKLDRPTNLYKMRAKSDNGEIETVVTIPSKEEEPSEEAEKEEDEGPSHTEIQWRLLNLGAQMGLNIWAPRADRGKSWGDRRIGDLPKLLANLPTQFDVITTKTVENIDVLWLAGQAIVAAFEVEHTTAVYSGLLRMSDLLTMQPNLDINLYLVGPDDRYSKFIREVARPTFASRSKPLHSLCGFLPYTKLCERIEETKNVVRFLKPEFIDQLAEYYDPSDDVG